MKGQLVSESNLREKAIYFNVKYFLTSAKELDTTSIPFNIVAQDVLLKVTSNPNTTYPGARKIESQQKNNGFSINFEKPKKIKRNKCCIN